MAISSELPEGVTLVSVDRMKGGGFVVMVETAKPVEGDVADAISKVVGEIEKKKSPVKLVTRLVQRSEN